MSLRSSRTVLLAAALGGSLLMTAGTVTAVRADTAPGEAAPIRAYARAEPWSPAGGLSDQARTATQRSSLARAALGLYEPFETGDTTVYDRLLTEDFVDVPLAPGQGPGREGMKAHVRDDIVATFPDLKIRVEAIHVAGRVVTVRSVISGTQVRPFLGVPATRRLLSYRAVDVHQFDHRRRIARTDHLEDLFGAYRQMTTPPK
ncbi:ester cyclase [Nonomuraea lactucae]|uniref:ester cyclase n=1 Tax=Nonomuraea lactucae TaxID=2249762 RepID=UPI000DE2C1B3|nr:ester cyclase [Nonomuraea lactucae]